MDGNDVMNDSTSFVLCFTCLLKIAIDRDNNELRGTFFFIASRSRVIYFNNETQVV